MNARKQLKKIVVVLSCLILLICSFSAQKPLNSKAAATSITLLNYTYTAPSTYPETKFFQVSSNSVVEAGDETNYQAKIVWTSATEQTIYLNNFNATITDTNTSGDFRYGLAITGESTVNIILSGSNSIKSETDSNQQYCIYGDKADFNISGDGSLTVGTDTASFFSAVQVKNLTIGGLAQLTVINNSDKSGVNGLYLYNSLTVKDDATLDINLAKAKSNVNGIVNGSNNSDAFIKVIDNATLDISIGTPSGNNSTTYGINTSSWPISFNTTGQISINVANSYCPNGIQAKSLTATDTDIDVSVGNVSDLRNVTSLGLQLTNSSADGLILNGTSNLSVTLGNGMGNNSSAYLTGVQIANTASISDSSNLNVSVNANTTRAYGIYAKGFTASGTSTVTSTVTGISTSTSAGMYIQGKTTLSSGTTVSTKGGESSDTSYGLYTSSGFDISGEYTSLTAKSDYGYYNSYGIYTSGSSTIEDATVTATAANSNSYSCGMQNNSSTTLSGDAKLIATNGKNSTSSYGISTYGLTMSDNAAITATAYGSSGSTYSVYSGNVLTMSESSTIDAVIANGTAPQIPAGSLYGIYADQNLTMTDNASMNIDVCDTTSFSTGLQSDKTTSLSNDTSITIVLGSCTTANGLRASNQGASITTNDTASINISVSAADNVAYGINGNSLTTNDASEITIVSTGNIMATGVNASLTMNGESTVDATANSNGTSYGINSGYNGSISINDHASLKATCSAPTTSIAMNTPSFTVNGGKAELSANTTASNSIASSSLPTLGTSTTFEVLYGNTAADAIKATDTEMTTEATYTDNSYVLIREITLAATVAITGVDTPVEDKAFDTTATSSDECVDTLTATTWSPAGVNGVAEAEVDYTASITVSPADGYYFDSTTTATINGEVATVTLNQDGTITVTYTVTSKAAPKEPTTEENTEATTEEVTTTTEEVTTTTEETTEATTEQKPADVTTTEAPTTEDTDDNSDAAASTGDMTPIALMFALLIISAAGIIVCNKKSSKC